jgi:hypothetical protein
MSTRVLPQRHLNVLRVPSNPGGFLRFGTVGMACQHRAMIEFRALPNDNP